MLMNFMKKIVYAENTQEYNEYVDARKNDHTYNKYVNFKKHMEEKVLPRFSEWSLKERLEKKLPTHNQNTTNYVEYSFRMTKDVQFSRLKAYNLTDLWMTANCTPDDVLVSATTVTITCSQTRSPNICTRKLKLIQMRSFNCQNLSI